MGDKVHGQKGNSPEQIIRPLKFNLVDKSFFI